MMHDTSVLCLTFSRDSELLASGSQDGKVKVWQIRTGKCMRKYVHFVVTLFVDIFIFLDLSKRIPKELLVFRLRVMGRRYLAALLMALCACMD